MTFDLPDEWIHVGGRRGEVLWVHQETYRDDGRLSRAHLSYYPDEETVELAVDGEYTFEYHDTATAAHETAQDLAVEATAALAERDDATFWESFTHTGGDR